MHSVKVGVSWNFAWVLLGRASSLGLGWGPGMVNGCVPGCSMERRDVARQVM